MKRLLTLALLALCLSGCGNPAPAEPTAPPDTPPAETTAPVAAPARYDAKASQALDPSGAVQLYSLAGLDGESVRVMGGDLVLFSAGETTTLVKLSGEGRYVSATAQLPICVPADAPSTQVGPKGITYYDESTRSLVFLNTALEEVNRIPLPDGIRGEPLLSADRKALYYATATDLQVIDLETRLDRLLLQTSYDRIRPAALHLGGTVLECEVVENGERFTLYLRTTTGETLATTGNNLVLHSNEELYFARLEDLGYAELLTGAPDQAPYILETRDYQPMTIPVMELSSLVTAVYGDDTICLELYSLNLGDRTASISLPGSGDCRSVVGDPATGELWMVWFDGQESRLLCWDPLLSDPGDDRVYRLPRRTASSPDTAGLAACADTALELSEKYGIGIHIWQEATEVQPEDYTLKAEYRVPLIRRCLEELDTQLARYPEGFFEKLVPGKGTLQLCLTGVITGREDAALDTSTGVQFWTESKVPYVAVTLGSSFARTLTHELFHVIDSRVLSACSIYDSWTDLNPEGFDYDYSYQHIPRNSDLQWTTGETRAFIDTYSMSFPREDRARIMELAMEEDAAEYFASETMQAKLHTLCSGIRKAFKLQKLAQDLPWEQYLNEKLAYQG